MKIYIVWTEAISGYPLIHGIFEDCEEAKLCGLQTGAHNWWISEETVVMKGDN